MALLAHGRELAAEAAERGTARVGAVAARHLLLDCEHPQVPFGLVVVEGDRQGTLGRRAPRPGRARAVRADCAQVTACGSHAGGGGVPVGDWPPGRSRADARSERRTLRAPPGARRWRPVLVPDRWRLSSGAAATSARWPRRADTALRARAVRADGGCCPAHGDPVRWPSRASSRHGRSPPESRAGCQSRRWHAARAGRGLRRGSGDPCWPHAPRQAVPPAARPSRRYAARGPAAARP